MQQQLAEALYAAIECSDQKEIDRLLLLGADINYQNNLGWTILQLACAKEQVGDVYKYITHGADVNLADCCGWAPLHTACRQGNLDIVKILINAGANPHQTMSNNSFEDPTTPLDIALEEGYSEIATYLKSIHKN